MPEREGPDFGKLSVALGFLAQDDLEKILRIQHVTKAPPDLSSKNPKISPSVNDRILRMFQKDTKPRPMPGERPQRGRSTRRC
jgi:hypothetical protein